MLNWVQLETLVFDCQYMSSDFLLLTRMYDVDGNGWIDILEMTKIVKSIYCMMGPQTESAEKRAKEIFRRMDRYIKYTLSLSFDIFDILQKFRWKSNQR